MNSSSERGLSQLIRIWLRCLVWPSLRRPWLLLASVGGIAAGTAILCALNLANQRAVRSFELSARGGSVGPSVEAAGPVRSVQWRRVGAGHVPLHALDACLREAPTGMSCQGILSAPLIITPSLGTQVGAPVEIQVIGIDGGPEAAGAPYFSEGLRQIADRVRLSPPAVLPNVIPHSAPMTSREWVVQNTVPGRDLFLVLDFPDAVPLLENRDSPVATGSGYDWIQASAAESKVSEADFNRLTQKIEAAFPVPLQRTSAGQVLEDQKSLTATYRFNLNVLGWMSILVGALLVSNVSAIYALLKRPVIGVLRQLGASRRQIFVLVLGEQCLLGLLGGVLGLVLGVQLESGISQRVLQTLSSLYVRAAATRPDLPVSTAVWTVLSGLGIYLVAGLQSTWALVSVPPASLGRRVLPEPDLHRGRWLRWLGIFVCLAVIFASPWVPPIAMRLWTDSDLPQPLGGYLAAGAILWLGYGLASPMYHWSARATLALVPDARASRFPGLAVAARRASSGRLLGRAQVATLAGGLSLVVGITLMVGGFRESLLHWLSVAFSADVVAEPLRVFPNEVRPRISEAQMQALRGLPGVRGLDCLLGGELRYQGRPLKVAGIEDALLPDQPVPVVGLDFPKNMSLREAALSLRSDTSQAWVSETFRSKTGLGRGDPLILELSPGHPAQFKIAGVIQEYSSEQGYILVSRGAYRQQTGLEGCTSMRLYLTPSTTLASLRRSVQANPDLRDGALRVYSAKDLRQSALHTFEQTFAVTRILTFLAAILGGVALLTQLVQGMVERRPEWMAIRRLGSSWWGLIRFCSADVWISVQTGLMLGSVCGGLLGWVLCYSINRQAFGWSVQFGDAGSVGQAARIALAFGGVLWVLGSLAGVAVLRRVADQRWERE